MLTDLLRDLLNALTYLLLTLLGISWHDDNDAAYVRELLA